VSARGRVVAWIGDIVCIFKPVSMLLRTWLETRLVEAWEPRGWLAGTGGKGRAEKGRKREGETSATRAILERRIISKE